VLIPVVNGDLFKYVPLGRISDIRQPLSARMR